MSENKKTTDSETHLGADEISEINGANEPAESVSSASQDTALKKEIDELKNSYLYLKADFENYKTQAIRERAELAKYGSERVVVALLDVLDTFDRALEMQINADNFNQFKEGMQMTAKELMNTLKRFGINEVDPQGKAFDPNIHEALSSEETDSVPEGHVCRVFKKAYKLHERVIRPAQVVVARAPATTDS